jgi:hypothetical protein
VHRLVHGAVFDARNMIRMQNARSDAVLHGMPRNPNAA